MNTKLIGTLFILLLIFFSCSEITYKEKVNKTKLIEGEYYSEFNSQNGLSIRENKIAFFEKLTFNSDDIYEFVIIDSILNEESKEVKIGTYLKMTDQKDTLYTEIQKILDSVIILKRNNKSETFKLKTRIVLK